MKGGSGMVMDWIWRLIWPLRVVMCLKTVIVSLQKGKGERTEYRDYGGIILLTVVGKINVVMLPDGVHRLTRMDCKPLDTPANQLIID